MSGRITGRERMLNAETQSRRGRIGEFVRSAPRTVATLAVHHASDPNPCHPERSEGPLVHRAAGAKNCGLRLGTRGPSEYLRVTIGRATFSSASTPLFSALPSRLCVAAFTPNWNPHER